MPGKFKTNVRIEDIDLSVRGQVSIKSTALLNTFIHSAPHALEKLASDVAPVPIDSVSVDDSGRIVIEDLAFRAKLDKMVTAKTTGDTNYVCNNAYQCKPKAVKTPGKSSEK